MLKKLRKSNQGFTIIEVLIVLAIAALILLIVFLAVPALQRNSRNTQRKNDVAAILGGYNDYVTNNNGSTPTGTTCVANPYKFIGGGNCASPSGGTASEFKLGYYTSPPNVIDGVGTPANATQGALGTDIVVVVKGARCGVGGATVGGSARQIAVQYSFEPNSTLTPTCTDS